MTYRFKILNSPVGKLKIVTSDKGLAGILWENDKSCRISYLNSAIEVQGGTILSEVEHQLTEYFKSSRQVFKLPLDFIGTPFNQAVWQALLSIPFGQTRTYGQIAKQMGTPNAARAVGMASSKNPISIVVPCHRVIGANGQLTGFAGGLESKAYLLDLESNSLRVSVNFTC